MPWKKRLKSRFNRFRHSGLNRILVASIEKLIAIDKAYRIGKNYTEAVGSSWQKVCQGNANLTRALGYGYRGHSTR